MLCNFNDPKEDYIFVSMPQNCFVKEVIENGWGQGACFARQSVSLGCEAPSVFGSVW